ncbi:hypothetical protein [Streptomyces sp. CB03911]|uniref:hypothetical protein n=1 Tax=Streptomyces sp. CB03911 TaxID=1804758 RepID=UPI000939C624|nr:hypothetical protein [Streptomyces sp. CB03911]OKI22226.1 hypothetical protein A6A07_34700 [Streptomyces sp. CB03911]
MARRRCGNDPNARLTAGDRAAIANFRQYLADRKAQTVTTPPEDSMHPARTLTAAATLLRTAATAATQAGRLRYEAGHTLGSRTAVVVDDHQNPTVLIEVWAKNREEVNAYLALLGPATSLALANWLESTAGQIDAVNYCDTHGDDHPCRCIAEPYLLAQAILGRAAGPDAASL